MHFLFFCQKYRFLCILLHYVLLFSVLFNEMFIKSIYQLIGCVNLHSVHCSWTLIWNIWQLLFFYVFYFPSEFVYLSFPPHIFFCLTKVWSMLHHGSVGRVQNKIKNTHIFSGTFVAVFVVTHNKNFVFIMMYTLNTAYFLWVGNVS